MNKNKSRKKSSYVVLRTTPYGHNAIYFVSASTLKEAIEVFLLRDCRGLKKLKNGKWQWEKDTYESVQEILAEDTYSSFEIQRLITPIKKPYDDIFCGIDWGNVRQNLKKSFPGIKKFGNFYEWYSPKRDFYAFFKVPKQERKRN